MSVLALALRRLELSRGTVPKDCPGGTACGDQDALRSPPNGTVPSGVSAGHCAKGGTDGTRGTVGTNGTGGTGTLAVLKAGSDGERRCFVCGQPASFGFGVFLREGKEGRWTCAAHRPHGEGGIKSEDFDIQPLHSPAAVRMRRHRERRRNGLRCLSIRDTEIETLVRKGSLPSENRNRPRAIVEALYAFLDRTLGSACDT